MSGTVVQVRKRGVVTLPAKLREKHNIQEGDTFRMVDLGGVFVLTRMVSLVPELAQEIERLRLEAGLTTDELLDGLREQREHAGLTHVLKSRRPRVSGVRALRAQRVFAPGSDRGVAYVW